MHTDILPRTTRVMFRMLVWTGVVSVMLTGPSSLVAAADVKTEVEAKLVETQKKAAPD